MPYINYNNLYSVKTLTSNDLIEDLSEFQKLICNDNYTKNIYTDELKDISFIAFDNSLNENSIDLDNGRIENTSQISINPRKYRYIKFDFQRYITIYNVKLYDVSYTPIPFILWTKSNNTNSYDISSDKVNEISLNNIDSNNVQAYKPIGNILTKVWNNEGIRLKTEIAFILGLLFELFEFLFED